MGNNERKVGILQGSQRRRLVLQWGTVILGNTVLVLPGIANSLFRRTATSSPGPISPPSLDIPAGLGKVESPVIPDSSTEELAPLAQRLREWVLPDGTKTADIIPQTQSSIELYEGKPLTYYGMTEPRFTSVTFEPDTILAAHIELSSIFYPATQGVVEVVAPTTGLRYTLPFLRSLGVSLNFDPTFRNTYAGLVVAIKEATDITEFTLFSEAYYRFATDRVGVHFTPNGPLVSRMTQQELIRSIVMAQTDLVEKPRREDGFRFFIDRGVNLRLGVLYANWLENYPREREKVIPGFGNHAEYILNIINQKDLITRVGNHWEWREGIPPPINHTSFLDWVFETR